MYKKLINYMTGAEEKTIIRLPDNAFIPFDPQNVDYQAYLLWCEQGNTPLPADEVTV